MVYLRWHGKFLITCMLLFFNYLFEILQLLYYENFKISKFHVFSVHWISLYCFSADLNVIITKRQMLSMFIWSRIGTPASMLLSLGSWPMIRILNRWIERMFLIYWFHRCSICGGTAGVWPPLLHLTPTSVYEHHLTPHFQAPQSYKILGKCNLTPISFATIQALYRNKFK